MGFNAATNSDDPDQLVYSAQNDLHIKHFAACIYQFSACLKPVMSQDATGSYTKICFMGPQLCVDMTSIKYIASTTTHLLKHYVFREHLY